MVVDPIAAAVEERRTGPGVDNVGSALVVVRSLEGDLVDTVAADRRVLADINTGLLSAKLRQVDLYTEGDAQPEYPDLRP